MDVIADFQSLSVVLVRGITLPNKTIIGRKVAIVAMNRARISATIGNELKLDGAIHGLACIDLTNAKFRNIAFLLGTFSEQNDLSSLGIKGVDSDILIADLLTKDSNRTSKALSFEILKTNESYTFDSIVDSSYQNQATKITLTLRMGSARYVHKPRFISELSLCIGEFRTSTENLGRSIRSAASGVARNIVSEKQTLSNQLDFLSNTMNRKIDADQIQSQTDSISRDLSLDHNSSGKAKVTLVIDTKIQSPILILPRNDNTVSEALVARLGEISLQNKSLTTTKMDRQQIIGDRILLQIENVSLSAVYGSFESKKETKNSCPYYYDILKDTTIKFVIDRFIDSFNIVSENSSKPDNGSPLLKINGAIVNPLQVTVNPKVYNHINDTLNNLLVDQVKNDTFKVQANNNREENESAILGDSSSANMKFEAGFSIPCISVTLFKEANADEIPLLNVSLEDFTMTANNLSDNVTSVKIKLYSLQVEDLMVLTDSENRYVAKSLSSRQTSTNDNLCVASPTIDEDLSDEIERDSALITINITIINENLDIVSV